MLTWVLFAVVAVSALVWAISTTRSAFSEALPTQTFTSGQTIAVDLDPADAPAIYAGYEGFSGFSVEVSYPFSSPVNVRCRLFGPVEDAALVRPERNLVIGADGVEWHQVYLLHVPEPGRYEVSCVGEGVRFGVGKDLQANWFELFAGPLAAVLATAAIAVVATIVLVRRRQAARRQLPPPTWPAPPPATPHP